MPYVAIPLKETPVRVTTIVTPTYRANKNNKPLTRPIKYTTDAKAFRG